MQNPNTLAQAHLRHTTHGPADLAQRIQALDVTQSFIVQAPAGSGKTELLAQRYLALLAIANEPEEIRAITFTNKAAYEMRARIIHALHRADTEPEPQAPHERFTWQLAQNALARSRAQTWDLLNNPNRLKITTIDAFYGALARRAPLASLVGGGMQIADNYQHCYTLAVRELLGSLEQNADWTPALEAVLTHVDNRFDRAEALLTSLLEKREHWLPLVLAARNTNDLRTTLEATLALIADDEVAHARAALDPYADELVAVAAIAARHLDPAKAGALMALQHIAQSNHLPAADQPQAWAALSQLLLTDKGAPRKAVTAAQGFPAPSSTRDKVLKAEYADNKAAFAALATTLADNPAAGEALQQLRTLPPRTYRDGEWAVLQHLLTLLPILAAKLLLVFQRQGELDHTEVAAAGLRVLGDGDSPTDLAQVLDAQLHHILIDEFQDTNHLQLQGLELITAGWELGDGRTLFVVGDPMQSIYGFRGSNVGLFINVARRGVGDIAVTPVQLSVNFRSQQGLVEWVNQTFAQVFPPVDNTNLGAISYSPSIPHLPGRDGDAVTLTAFAGDPAAARQAEARWLADQMTQLRAVEPGSSIAILVRNRSHLQEVVVALREKQVDFQAIDIDPLKDHPSIRDLTALTRALCHLGDRTAWLALLRSPLCGLDLAQLEHIAQGGPNTLIWDNLKKAGLLNGLADEAQQRVYGLVSVMRDSLRWREKKTLATLVEGAWVALHGPCCLQHEVDVTNVRVFFDTLKSFSYSTFELAAFAAALERLYAKADVQGGAQLMTLHKSKGLEFDHVFIPGCGRLPRAGDSRLLAWDRYTTREGRELPLLSPSPEIGGDANALYAFITKQERTRTQLERDRILYVGCTRAINRLYLTGCVGLDDNGDVAKPTANSFLGTLWPAIAGQVDIKTVAPPLDTVHEGDRPRGPVSRRFSPTAPKPDLPACDLLAAYRGRMASDNSELPDLAWTVDYSRQLGELFHRILRRVCLDGVEQWPRSVIDARKSTWRNQLLELGVPTYLAPSFTNRLAEWLVVTLNNRRACWMLDHNHAGSACELSVSTWQTGKLARHTIDRTFIDAGVRWVIDYKTCLPGNGETVEDFVARMIEEHRPQVQRYVTLMADLGDEPVQGCLYLVSIRRFVQIRPQPTEIAA